MTKWGDSSFTDRTNSPSPKIRSSAACLSPRLLKAKTDRYLNFLDIQYSFSL